MFVFRPRHFERLAFTGGDAAAGAMSFRAPVPHPAAPLSFRSPALAVPGGGAVAKRIADIAIALPLLMLFTLPMLLFAQLIRLDSPGPVLFRQERVGQYGKRFVMLKFRTMRHESESTGQWCQATRDDPRVTRIGHFLRRTSMDELPQLLNVLAGTMSMVGPRPHAPGTCAAGRPFEHITAHYAARHCVKPGVTGLAQVRGWRGETDTEEKLLRRLDSDLEYIAHHSLATDLLILCRTVVAVARMLNAY